MRNAKHTGSHVTMHCSKSVTEGCTAKNVAGFSTHVGRKHRNCSHGQRIHAKKGTKLEALAREGAVINRGVWVMGLAPKE